MTKKIDLFRDNRDEYAMPREPKIVGVSAGRYLTVSGEGGPHEEEFQQKLGGLYALAHTVKFDEKARGRDFKVGVLGSPPRAGTPPANDPAAPRGAWPSAHSVRLVLPGDAEDRYSPRRARRVCG